jgi:hypothetical protein
MDVADLERRGAEGVDVKKGGLRLDVLAGGGERPGAAGPIRPRTGATA